MPDAKHSGLILLLSDTHFGTSPLGDTYVPPIEPSALGQLLQAAGPVREFFRTKCASHDGAMTERFPAYLRSVLADEATHGFHSSHVDLCLLLGDQVTFPDPEACSVLVSYLTQFSFKVSTPFGTLTCAGLQLPSDRIMAVPGNHDKLLSTTLDAYHAGVSVPIGLRSEPKEQTCVFSSRTFGAWEWLFMVVDASEYCRRDLVFDDSYFEYRRHLAAGRITESIREQVRDRLRLLAAGRAVDGAELQDFESATKVLVIHYAASRWAVSGFPSRDEMALPHGCRNINRLLDDLKDHLDLVIHGHLHVPKIYRHKGVPVISAPTLSQLANPTNGFYMLRLFTEGTRRWIRADHHRWEYPSFLPDPSRSERLEFRRAVAEAMKAEA